MGTLSKHSVVCVIITNNISNGVTAHASFPISINQLQAVRYYIEIAP